jgi:sucrose porin
MSDDWKTNFSIIGNQHDGDTTGGASYDLEAYTFTMNNLIGDHWELMFNGIAANKNNERTSLSTTQPVPDRDDIAEYGAHMMLGYKTNSFYGISDGWSRTGMMYGHAMGAETKNLGQDNHLLKDADSVRFYTVGATRFADNWRIAPSLLTEFSQDRYLKGDEYKWAVFNVRLAQEFNQNFEIAYEGTYQYLDLDNTSEKIDGSVYKATFAPTFKIADVAGFFDRPQIRFAVTYVDWSDKFKDSYYINGVDYGMGQNEETVFAVQMETWF